MNYRLIPYHHSKLLSSILYDVYELSSHYQSTMYSTAPNGIIGISIKISGQSFFKQGSSWELIPKCSIYGLINRPDNIKMNEKFREIAIGFKPFFFQLLSTQNMSDIVNTPFIEASNVFDKFAVEKLVSTLQNEISDLKIIAAIEHFVSFHVLENNYDPRILHAMNLIYNERRYNIDEICKEVNLSSTGLRNLFKNKMGRSPKDVAKIIRLNQTLKSYNPETKLSLQDIAFNNGYFDQAHFIHDFKSFIDLTPKEYFGNKTLTFDFYNYKRWSGDIFDRKVEL